MALGHTEIGFKLFQYLNYVMKVMVSEILIKIYMVVNDMGYEDAEQATMDLTS